MQKGPVIGLNVSSARTMIIRCPSNFGSYHQPGPCGSTATARASATLIESSTLSCCDQALITARRAQCPAGTPRRPEFRTRTLLEYTVALSELYNQRVLEEICTDLNLATTPCYPTVGRPVMELAGIPEDLIDWAATRNEATMQRLGELVAEDPPPHDGPRLH
ncbi:hypothetical protein [Streptomyces sp. NPDC057580]|uniref:hypothetical protein n=1 Tax=Streptomyces sp. NPDC057580 TaxID=3346173 RepID=UPI00369F3AB3